MNRIGMGYCERNREEQERGRQRKKRRKEETRSMYSRFSPEKFFTIAA